MTEQDLLPGLERLDVLAKSRARLIGTDAVFWARFIDWWWVYGCWRNDWCDRRKTG